MVTNAKKVFDTNLDLTDVNESIYGSAGNVDHAFAKYFLTVQKKLLPDFQKLDLSLNEARILIYLMIRKHSTATDVSKYTGIGRTETYHYLSNLLSKGVVLSTFDRPQKYYALAYADAIDCLIRAKQNALRTVSENKDENQNMINSVIEGMVLPEQEGKESYQVIVGEDPVYAKMAKMLSAANSDVSVLLSEKYLVNLYHAEITDQMLELAEKGLRVELHTPSKKVTQYISDEDGGHKMALKMVDSANAPIDFILVDDKEMMILLDNRMMPGRKQDFCGFCTNNQSLIAAFRFMFNKTINS